MTLCFYNIWNSCFFGAMYCDCLNFIRFIKAQKKLCFETYSDTYRVSPIRLISFGVSFLVQIRNLVWSYGSLLLKNLEILKLPLKAGRKDTELPNYFKPEILYIFYFVQMTYGQIG